jgi:DNA-directed RNA polymerase subunit RPC12/RpoP
MNERKFDRGKFIEKLQEKGADKECPRCGGKTFSLMNGYTFMPINETTDNIPGGPSIPAILVICVNCGAITPYALGAFENLNPIEI